MRYVPVCPFVIGVHVIIWGGFMRYAPICSAPNWCPHQHSGQFNEIYPDLPITVGSTTRHSAFGRPLVLIMRLRFSTSAFIPVPCGTAVESGQTEGEFFTPQNARRCAKRNKVNVSA